jgi:hypothetical protein
MTPASPPDTVQNGSARELRYAPIMPPDRPISVLNANAERFIGCP